MTLGEATSRFLSYVRHGPSTIQPQIRYEIHEQTLRLVTAYYSNDATLGEITPSSLRDFISRWYVERASGSKPGRTQQDSNALLTPEPLDILDSMEEFFGWADQQIGAAQARGLQPLLDELRRTLPRTLEITNALTGALQAGGGPFIFPEFLTSFEEGGSSQYDIDVPGNVGAIDGYFRIIRVEGLLAEAEELISEDRVWPIIFPAEVAGLLEHGYILNLELVRKAEGWRIAGCGFAFPPGTEIG